MAGGSVAVRYNPFPTVDRTVAHSAGPAFLADELVLILHLGFAPAIWRAAETTARALFRHPSRDSLWEANTRTVAPGPWQPTGTERHLPSGQKLPPRSDRY